MNKEQLNKYMNTTVFFKLKDFTATSEKYAGYKCEKFEEGLNDYNSLYRVEDFEEILFNSNGFNPYVDNIGRAQTDVSKSNIRMLATEINSIMRNSIEAHIRWIWDDELNENEVKCFTIKYYLEYYEGINEAMTNILKSFIIYE